MIRDEVAELERVVADVQRYAPAFADRQPDILEARGLATLMHDHYTGLERIFAAVASEFDGGAPSSGQWHRQLLRQMTLDVPSVRPPVLDKATGERVDDYLRFRHRFRNLYGHRLDWRRMQPLLRDLPAVHAAVTADLQRFEAFLDSLSSGLERSEQQ